MGQYEERFVKLHRLLEKRLGTLKEAYKLEELDGVPNAYDVLNSRKVDDWLRDSAKYDYLEPGHLDVEAVAGRYRAALKIVNTDRWQNDDDKEFSGIMQMALDDAKEILSKKDTEQAYAQWLRKKQSKQPHIDRDAEREEEERKKREREEEERKKQERAEEERRKRERAEEERRKRERAEEERRKRERAEEQNLPYLMDQAINRLRSRKELERKAGGATRRKEFVLQQDQRNKKEQAIQANLKTKNSGFFSRVSRLATCGLGAHKGEWYYGDTDTCNQSMMCERCGNTIDRVDHSWEEQVRILDTQCAFIKFCRRCGNESTELKHDWNWEYLHTKNCEQQKKCRHCGQLGTETKTTHKWGEWSDSGFDYAKTRTCNRCGQREVKENAPVEPRTGMGNVIESRQSSSEETFPPRRIEETKPKIKAPLNLAGNWQAPDGMIQQIEQHGNELTIWSKDLAGGVTRGQGRIDGNIVQYQFVYDRPYVHNEGMAQLEVRSDGRMMQGYFQSMLGGGFISFTKR